MAILIALAFVSQASAVLRPLFPIKPSAPFNGELIVIGDELARSAKKPSMHHPVQAQVGSAWIGAIAFVMTAVPCVTDLLRRHPRGSNAGFMETYKPRSDILGDLERFGVASLYSRHRRAAGL